MTYSQKDPEPGGMVPYTASPGLYSQPAGTSATVPAKSKP
eukprot:CAMPEP_0173467902 /NCGR_PEP_ID=MMETSP1357-20121228/75907_1 /TAXON_ID=77926 /ORGANISM="Hemiselmis rufescens, Strain PCC563" /LENGTH=39 /DNA_ID= /DNA_START= /DNA_END= /DNA_ORIENTATION=